MDGRWGLKFSLAGCVALGAGGCASGELYLERTAGDGETKILVAGVDGFMDPVLKNDLHKLGHDIHRECNATVVVNSVDFEGRNMGRIRKAHSDGERIALVGYSMGSERVYSLARQCARENIRIDLIVFYDPTFTAVTPMYKPDNVGRCIAYFSLGPFKGDKRNLRGEIEIRNSLKDHFNMVNWGDLGNDWREDVSEMRKR